MRTRAATAAALLGVLVWLTATGAAGAGSTGTSPGTSTGVVRRVELGSSVLGRPIGAVELGDPASRTKVVVVGCIHGNECAGIRIVRALEQSSVPAGIDLWLVPDANPDGRAAGTRVNAHGVDLNRNFPWHWQPSQANDNPHYSGPYPISETESRILYTLLTTLRPRLVIWYHQQLAVIDESGGDLALERGYSQLVGLPLKRLPRYPGSATSWANHAFPGATSFVVELPRGQLTAAGAHRHAAAVLALARTVAAGTPTPR